MARLMVSRPSQPRTIRKLSMVLHLSTTNTSTEQFGQKSKRADDTKCTCLALEGKRPHTTPVRRRSNRTKPCEAAGRVNDHTKRCTHEDQPQTHTRVQRLEQRSTSSNRSKQRITGTDASDKQDGNNLANYMEVGGRRRINQYPKSNSSLRAISRYPLSRAGCPSGPIWQSR